MKKEHLKIEIAKIKKYPKNPKRHADALIEKSIRELGFVDDIIVDENNNLLAGHGRIAALEKLNQKEVDAIKITGWTEEQKRRYALLSNKSVEAGGWDYDLLKDYEEEDLNFAGFESEELDKIFELETSEDDFDAEAEYEKIKECKIKRGDLFQIDSHRLLCGNSTLREDVQKLMEGEKADMVFTDPPYGMNKGFANDEKQDFTLENWQKEWMKEIDDFSKENINVVIFHSPRLFWTLIRPAIDLGWKIGRYFSLYKPNDMTFPWHCWLGVSESILLFQKGKSKFNNQRPKDTSFWHDTYLWNHKGLISGENKTDRQSYHPTVKPLPVCSDLIWKCSFYKDIVLDLFGGSGSTLIACEQLNRKCFIMELDPKYCQVIINRWSKLTRKEPKKLN